MKVSIDALRNEMHLRSEQSSKDFDSLKAEVRLRDETQTKNLDSLREELRLRLDSVREELRSSAQTLHDELRVRDEKQALAMKNLSDKLDFAIDIRERLVQLEARMPRTQ